MTLTVELPPELEAQLRAEAARAGQDPDTFIRSTLQERLRPSNHRPQALPPHLKRSEAELLQKINQGLPSELWERYHELVARRRAETLTPEEHARLIEVSDQIEAANARRIALLVELAGLRQTTLEALMDQLGIKSPGYA
jgi:hypothetical protein